MKVLIFLLGLVFSYLNAVYFMNYYDSPLFKLGIYLGLALMVYPFITIRHRQKSKRYL